MKYNASFWFVINIFAIIVLELLFPIAATFTLALPLGLLFLSGAIVITLWSKRIYSRHRTSYDPKEKAAHLITQSLYSLSRNPIYIALIFAFIGISLILSLHYFVLGVLSLFAILSKLVIPYEEEELYAIFGTEYLKYKTSTPKWL
jgi:protein-S-isoprenylcysteine O-methyltransferase Ste14